MTPFIAEHCFAFTNGDLGSGSCISPVWWDSLGWPFHTLYKFKMFLRISEQLQSFSHVAFLNANCVVLQPIPFEDFFAPDADLVACCHLGFFDKPPSVYTYECRPQSTAYVRDGSIYRAGGLMGGRAEVFLAAAAELAANIERDLDNGVVALWHDESQWNAYLDTRAPELDLNVHDLSPAYLYPESWNLPFDARILLREKSKVIDVQRTKGQPSNDVRLGHAEEPQIWMRRLWTRALHGQ